MERGRLSRYFTGIAYKRLTRVEVPGLGSTQHEFNGVQKLKEILGRERRSGQAAFVYMMDDDDEPLREEATITWYDAREATPGRTEHRLYYQTTIVSDQFAEGDLAIIARRPDDTLLIVVAEQGSTVEQQLLWLFGLSDATPGFSVKGELETGQLKLEFAVRYILELLGEEVVETNDDYLELMLRKFDGSFPTTRVFSEFARSTVAGVDARQDPDGALLAWYEREEVLFRTLEKHLLADRLQHGFGGTGAVEKFVELAKTVQQKRRSRAGYALENHLEKMFETNGVSFSRGKTTEGKAKPDFLFPSIDAYRDPVFPEDRLTMVGAKSTCKDRWRQILPEARRIRRKHLFTLEPRISESQTAEMREHGVTLVLPSALHETFRLVQRGELMTAAELIGLLRDRATVGGTRETLLI